MPVKEKRIILSVIADPYGKSAAISGYTIDNKEEYLNKLFTKMMDIPDAFKLSRREMDMLDGLEILDWEKKNWPKKGAKGKCRF